MLRAFDGSSCGPPVELPQDGFEQTRFALWAITRFTSSEKSSRMWLADIVLRAVGLAFTRPIRTSVARGGPSASLRSAQDDGGLGWVLAFPPFRLRSG